MRKASHGPAKSRPNERSPTSANWTGWRRSAPEDVTSDPAAKGLLPTARSGSSGRINVADWLNGTPPLDLNEADTHALEDAPAPASREAEAQAAKPQYTAQRHATPALSEPTPSGQGSSMPPSRRRTYRQTITSEQPDPATHKAPQLQPPASSEPNVMDLADRLMELSAAQAASQEPSEPAAVAPRETLQTNQPGMTLDLNSAHLENTPSAEQDPALIEQDEALTEQDAPPTAEPAELLPVEQEAPATSSRSDGLRQIEPPRSLDSVEDERAAGDARTTEQMEADDDVPQSEIQEDEPAESTEPARTAPVVPQKQFSRELIELRDRNRACLMYYYQRPENAAERSPWGVMHALISYGVDTELVAGRQKVNAIGWLCYNRPCRGMQLFTFDGRFPVPQNGPGYQGHEGQFLSMLALSRVKPTYPIRVDGQEFTVQDLIEYEQYTCRPKSELTFKLISLAHYLPSDATWTSKWGETWSIPRLIEEELAQPINGACCGGTHRLIGYSMAVQVRRKRGETLDGQWLRAAKYVDAYHKYVVKLQNRDGSFSTSWLKSRDSSGDIDRRIQTTGHVLEWLVFSLPEDELTDPRVVRAVNFLSSSLLRYRTKDWEIGPRGHAPARAGSVQ